VTGGIVFLLVALACSAVATLVLWLGSRQPSSMEHHVEEFSREMQALSPDGTPPVRRTARPGPTPDPGRD
jgi:hypothetical protein